MLRKHLAWILLGLSLALNVAFVGGFVHARYFAEPSPLAELALGDVRAFLAGVDDEEGVTWEAKADEDKRRGKVEGNEPGGEYNFGQFGLRAEYEVIEDFSMLSFGGMYRF